MLMGAPRDFDELVRQFGKVIESVESCDVLQVARRLWRRGVLRNYRPPPLVTLTELQEYIGVSMTLWGYALQQPLKRLALPVPVQGKMSDPASTYRFADAQSFLQKRGNVFQVLEKRHGFKATRLPAYDVFLISETKKIVEEMKQGYVFDLPPDLPQNDGDLQVQYTLTVAQVVRRRLKYGIEIEDAIQEVWTKLFEARVLRNFMRSGPSRLPAQMTVDEALDFLGVDWPAWERMMKGYADAPNPIKGAASSKMALYQSEDITALDQSGYFLKRGPRALPRFSVSRDMLNRYMMRAADSRMKNIFRTLERRFNREDTLQEGAYISNNAVRIRRDKRLGGQSWEDSLRSDAIGADQMCELKERLGIAAEVYEVFTALTG